MENLNIINQLENKLEEERMINSCIQKLIMTENFNIAVNDVLKNLLQYYHANRSYIIMLDSYTQKEKIIYEQYGKDVANENKKTNKVQFSYNGQIKGFLCLDGVKLEIGNLRVAEEIAQLVGREIQKIEEKSNLMQSEEKFRITLSNIAEVMFDNILEADITKDIIYGKNCDSLADLLKIPHGSSYTQTIDAISNNLTHPDFAEEYRRVLSRDNILQLAEQGIKMLQHECIERSDGINYKWIRVHYCIYKSEITDTIHVISYVKNIDHEKNGAIQLIGKAQKVLMNYERIAEISIKNDTFIRYTTTKDKIIVASGSDCYSKQIIDNAKFVANDAERIEFQEKMALENIVENLKTHDVISHTFPVDENGIQKMKKVNFFYLDEFHEKICCTVTDITEMIKTENDKNELLSSALLAAKQASSAKSDFLSRMSHEIRTPMNAIIGMSTIAAQSIGNDVQVADCISKIGISSRFLLSLINDILDMSRIESGKILLKSEKIPFEEFLNGINSICITQANAKDIDYENIVDSGIDDYYIGDAMKLQQVVINIVSNAIKFTPQGGRVTLSVHQVKKSKNAATIRFVVNDTGCGIAEEFMPHLYDAFAQERSGTTNMYGGTGLGLAICKNLVEMMDGNINARSIVGVGTEFTVDVKLGVTEESKTRYISNFKPHFEQLSALVVDDEIIVCEQTVITLKEIGMVSEWVDSGEKAVALVKEKLNHKKHFDFILLDWKMPNMDGIETARQIRHIVGPDVTIIIMTAYDWTNIEYEAKMAGVNLLMNKPMFKSSLISAFEKALGKQVEKETIITKDFKFDGKRVLLAEDHPLNVEVAKRLLERKGFLVEHAENGLRALEMFTSSAVGYYDAILMDIRMPEMDGLQSSYNIRRWRKEDAKSIPIIAMTANAFDDDIQKSKSAGMNAHLAKPIEPQILYQTLYDFIFNGRSVDK